MSLFTKLVLANSTLVVAAVLLLVLTPATVGYPIREIEAFVLLVMLLVVIAANWSLTRRIIRPLRDLGALMASIDAADDALPEATPVENDEVAAMARAFRAMMGRLESERTGASALALRAQEHERVRVSRELHDQVGQSLTALLLSLSMFKRQAPDNLHGDLDELAESVRTALEEVRGISARLRPGILHELGLRAALEDLGRSFSHSDALTVEVTIGKFVTETSGLSDDQELVVFRVAQEALTNVARHSGGDRAAVTFTTIGDHVELTITDNGCGEAGRAGNGRAGMRERARLAGGTVTTEAQPGVGTTVRLIIPLPTLPSPTRTPEKAPS